MKFVRRGPPIFNIRALVFVEYLREKILRANSVSGYVFISTEKENSIAIAHNLQGYDSYFLLEFLYKNALYTYNLLSGSSDSFKSRSRSDRVFANGIDLSDRVPRIDRGVIFSSKLRLII